MIHRYWSGPPLPDAERSARALASLNPGAMIRDWTDDELPVSVVDWLDAHASKVIAPDRPRHRGNMVRLWALDTYGGWWVDHDVVMLRPFSQLPRSGAIGTVWDKAASCILGLPAGHALARAGIAAIEAYAGPPAPCPDVSGDRLLERLRATHGAGLRALPLPFDTAGRYTGVAAPVAVHGWRTSSQRVAA